MNSEACNSRVEAFSDQIGQQEGEKAALEENRQSLDLPARKQDFLNQILTNLQGIVAAVPNPPKNTPSPLTRGEGAHSGQVQVGGLVPDSPGISGSHTVRFGSPYGTRTRVTAVRGRRPRPLDEGACIPMAGRGRR